MTPDNGQHFIIEACQGEMRAYPCTVEAARRLFAAQERRLPEAVRTLVLELESPETGERVSAQAMAAALHELYRAPRARPLAKLRELLHGPRAAAGPDTRPEVLATVGLQGELLAWMHSRFVLPRRLELLDAAELATLAPEESLSFLAPLIERQAGKPLRYVEGRTLEAARELVALQARAWPADSAEHDVVGRWLGFINRWMAESQVRYDLAAMRA